MINETSNIGQIANILNIVDLRLGYLVNCDDINKAKLCALAMKKYITGINIGLRLERNMPKEYIELEKEAEDIYNSEIAMLDYVFRQRRNKHD